MKLFAKRRKILVIVIGLLLILSLNFFQKEVKGFFYSISEPVQKSLWKTGDWVSDFFGAIFEARNLGKENEELKLKIQELLAENSVLKELEKENKTLREALELGLERDFKLELAKVIGKDVNQDAILIDKGFKDGISRGLLVITSQKVLVGSILEVYQGYSKVLLISSKESSFEAKIAESNVSGIVKGKGSSGVYLDLIPKDTEIKVGDLVVSDGFLVGLVQEVKKTDIDPFQQAELSPFFNISTTDKLFIIINF